MELIFFLMDLMLWPAAILLALFMTDEVEIDNFQSAAIAAGMITILNALMGQLFLILAPALLGGMFMVGGIFAVALSTVIYAIPVILVCSFVPGIRLPDLTSGARVALISAVFMSISHFVLNLLIQLGVSTGGGAAHPAAPVS